MQNVSVPRVIKMTLLGIVLLFAYMVAFATPAHAQHGGHHGGRDVGQAIVGLVAVTGVLVALDALTGRRQVAQPMYVMQPPPVYVARPPQCYMAPRQMADAYGNPLYVSVDGQLRPATRLVQVCEYE
jgi:hypothetical protein